MHSSYLYYTREKYPVDFSLILRDNNSSSNISGFDFFYKSDNQDVWTRVSQTAQLGSDTYQLYIPGYDRIVNRTTQYYIVVRNSVDAVNVLPPDGCYSPAEVTAPDEVFNWLNVDFISPADGSSFESGITLTAQSDNAETVAY